MKFGLILPHFGTHANASRLTEGAVEAERLRFDSVWVRDHVVYQPHGFEDPDPTWLDPFIVLSAIAARTATLVLGTAVLIPFRHPIHVAQLLASLAAFVGPERLLPVWGRGNDDREFAAIGAEVKRRGEVLEEQLEIIRSLWRGEPVDFTGRHYSFKDVRIASPGLRAPLAHWYGGSSDRAVERVVRLFDGALIGGPRSVVKRRIDHMRDLSTSQGRPMPTVGHKALISLDEAGPVVERLVQNVARAYPEKNIQSAADSEGAVIAGSPDLILEEVMACAEIGVDHFIFDLRVHFDRWEEGFRRIAEGVLPAARELLTRRNAGSMARDGVAVSHPNPRHH